MNKTDKLQTLPSGIINFHSRIYSLLILQNEAEFLGHMFKKMFKFVQDHDFFSLSSSTYALQESRVIVAPDHTQ